MKYETLIYFLQRQSELSVLPSPLLLPDAAIASLAFLISLRDSEVMSIEQANIVCNDLDYIVRKKEPIQGWMLPHLAMYMISQGGKIDQHAVHGDPNIASMKLRVYNQALHPIRATWSLSRRSGRCVFNFE